MHAMLKTLKPVYIAFASHQQMTTSSCKVVPWKELLDSSLAVNKHLIHSKYMQIATIKKNGRPANRTVVFRGFLSAASMSAGDTLTFVTDSRSEKIEQILTYPYAEVAWYFPESREQYRISAEIEIIGPGHLDADLQTARHQAWKNMSDAGRQQFTYSHPGVPRPDKDDRSDLTVPAPAKDDPVLDTFCLVTLRPDHVDYVNLKSTRRYVFNKLNSSDWTSIEVSP